MRLVLMRHAEAGEADPARWPDDRARPLTDAGRRQHAQMAEALRRMGLRFDRILTSPLVRARETADITARVYASGPAPEPTELLGDRADLAAIVDLLAGIGPETLLCVGHEPTLSRLVALLTSRNAGARVEMAKSGVAVLECPAPPTPGRCSLQMHLRPAEIIRLLGSAEVASAPSRTGA